MSENCECENDDENISELIMTVLEGLTFLCAIFVTILYTWEFHDKFSKKKKRNRRTSGCLPRIRSDNSNNEELDTVFED